MDKIMNFPKWIMVCQAIGIVCIFVAFYVPIEETIRNALFIFGIGVILGYLILLFNNVYKPLKERAAAKMLSLMTTDFSSFNH